MVPGNSVRGPSCASGALAFALVFLVSGGGLASVAHAGQAKQGETLGFVLTRFSHATVDKDDCPSGVNRGMRQILLERATADEQALFRKDQTALSLRATLIPDGPDKGKLICQNPRAMKAPEPLKLVQGSATVVPGLDLDGFGSLTKPRGASCAHQDFTGADGKVSVDNQLYRVMGCIKPFQAAGSYHQNMQAALRSGNHSVVVEVTGVDDRLNDPDVEVAIYSSRDPTPFSGAGKPLPYGSITVNPDKKFWGGAHGRIVKGVLTTEPMNIRLLTPQNSIDTEQPFLDARLQVTLKPDGTIEGLLAGYRPIEEYYFNQVAQRNFRNFGDLAAGNHFTCPAMYDALKEQADGLRNPATGQCEGISSALVLAGSPVYVIK